jgi:predicted nucleotidyltransferase
VPPVSAASESAPLRRIVRRLVEAVDPERILLFGSRAKGTASGESDLDLCVIAEMEGDRRERRNRLHKLVRPEHDGPVDVLTFTPAEFAREKHLLNSVTYFIEKHGRTLYRKSDLPPATWQNLPKASTTTGCADGSRKPTATCAPRA